MDPLCSGEQWDSCTMPTRYLPSPSFPSFSYFPFSLFFPFPRLFSLPHFISLQFTAASCEEGGEEEVGEDNIGLGTYLSSLLCFALLCFALLCFFSLLFSFSSSSYVYLQRTFTLSRDLCARPPQRQQVK